MLINNPMPLTIGPNFRPKTTCATHQFIAKPFAPAELRNKVLRSMCANEWLVNDAMKEIVTVVRIQSADLPTRLARTLDKSGLDGIVDGAAAAVLAAGRRGARLQSGRINSYVLGIAAGVAGLVVLAYFLTM